MCLGGAVGRMPWARHIPMVFCGIEVGGDWVLLLNQLLGLEEATKVENLPGS